MGIGNFKLKNMLNIVSESSTKKIPEVSLAKFLIAILVQVIITPSKVLCLLSTTNKIS